MRYLYSFIIYLISPIVVTRLLLRSRFYPNYRQRWRERFGLISKCQSPNIIWVHAVSLGEAIVATPLIKALQKSLPEYQIYVTTMTATGSAHIQKSFENSVLHTYVPYDLPGTIKRFLKNIRPKIVIVMETELWPNLLHYTHQANIPILLANARLSEKSSKGYRLIKWLTKPMLQNISLIAAQTAADQNRLTQLGADKNKIKIAGNIKFDISPPAGISEKAQQLKSSWGMSRQVFIAASTHSGEDEIILEAFKKIRGKIPTALLILVPRHPERFEEVAELAQQQEFTIARRSHANSINESIDVFIGDSIGELWLFYACADVAFVGGSLIERGGHNLLEPAALGLPLISGPHTFNFALITQLMLEKQALTIIHNANELSDKVIMLLENKNLAKQQGSAALNVVEENRGALEKHVEFVRELLSL